MIDARGVPGWEAVDNLAAYLLSLDLSATALSAAEANNIVAPNCLTVTREQQNTRGRLSRVLYVREVAGEHQENVTLQHRVYRVVRGMFGTMYHRQHITVNKIKITVPL